MLIKLLQQREQPTVAKHKITALWGVTSNIP
jgi:hypothetical protein